MITTCLSPHPHPSFDHPNIWQVQIMQLLTMQFFFSLVQIFSAPCSDTPSVYGLPLTCQYFSVLNISWYLVIFLLHTADDKSMHRDYQGYVITESGTSLQTISGEPVTSTFPQNVDYHLPQDHNLNFQFHENIKSKTIVFWSFISSWTTNILNVKFDFLFHSSCHVMNTVITFLKHTDDCHYAGRACACMHIWHSSEKVCCEEK